MDRGILAIPLHDRDADDGNVDAAVDSFGMVDFRFQHRLLDVGRHDDCNDAPFRISDRAGVYRHLPQTRTGHLSFILAVRARLFEHLAFIQRCFDVIAMANARPALAVSNDGQQQSDSRHCDTIIGWRLSVFSDQERLPKLLPKPGRLFNEPMARWRNGRFSNGYTTWSCLLGLLLGRNARDVFGWSDEHYRHAGFDVAHHARKIESI